MPRRYAALGRPFFRGARPAYRPAEGPRLVSAHDEAELAALQQLDRFGIEVVAVKSFLWGGYRYSSARDAVAAAKRSIVK